MKSPVLVIVMVAILWAAVIFAVGSTLHGTAFLSPVLVYIGGGAATTLILVGTTLRRLQAFIR
jgi:hypothetical protein